MNNKTTIKHRTPTNIPRYIKQLINNNVRFLVILAAILKTCTIIQKGAISQLANIGFRIKHIKLPKRNVSDPLSSEKSPYLILLKFVFRDSVFCEYKVISPFSI